VGKVAAGVPSVASRREINGGLSESAVSVGARVTADGVARESSRISKWFVAGVVALIFSGMMFGAAAVMYIHDRSNSSAESAERYGYARVACDQFP